MTAVRALTPEERQRGRRAALMRAADDLEASLAEIPPPPSYEPSKCTDAEGRTHAYEAYQAEVNARRQHFAALADLMRSHYDARITDQGSASRMTLRGVTCSCTGGLPGLFPAWLRKARAEVERLA